MPTVVGRIIPDSNPPVATNPDSLEFWCPTPVSSVYAVDRPLHSRVFTRPHRNLHVKVHVSHTELVARTDAHLDQCREHSLSRGAGLA